MTGCSPRPPPPHPMFACAGEVTVSLMTAARTGVLVRASVRSSVADCMASQFCRCHGSHEGPATLDKDVSPRSGRALHFSDRPVAIGLLLMRHCVSTRPTQDVLDVVANPGCPSPALGGSSLLCLVAPLTIG